MSEVLIHDLNPNQSTSNRWFVAGVASLALLGTPTIARAVDSAPVAEVAQVECGPETPTDQLPVLNYREKSALRGSCVSYMQSLMVKHRRLTLEQADGVFGPTTEGELEGFQIQNSIPNTGNVGPLTWPALRADTSNHGLPKVCLDMKRGACVSKDDRRTRLIQNGRVIASYPSRFGDARGSKYRTDEGIFTVQRKEVMSYSKEFNNAPMPYSVYYNAGEAFHYSAGFARDGYAGASHGCVNLKKQAAIKTFNWVKEGSPVVVY